MALTSPTFLGLPLELRYIIFSHLWHIGPISCPFWDSPIASISHGAPPLALLLTCRQVCSEARNYFHGITTLTFPLTLYPRVARENLDADSLVAIRAARKVELVLIWNVGSSSNGRLARPSFSKEHVMELVGIFESEAHMLESVKLSVQGASVADWEENRSLLEPLQLLKGKAQFVVGCVIATGEEQNDVERVVEKYVRELNE